MRKGGRLLLALHFFGGALWAAGEDYASRKREIFLLAEERVAAFPSDFERVLKTGEDRLRGLHADYESAGRAPSNALNADISALKNSLLQIKTRRNKARRAASQECLSLLNRHWEAYRRGLEAIGQKIDGSKLAGEEGAVYWTAVREFADLSGETAKKTFFIPPEGAHSVESVFRRDECGLLRKLEPRAQERLSCSVCLADLGLPGPNNVSPFYQSQGLLPQSPPVSSGGWEIPAGCRTVSEKRSGAKLIVRVSAGRGGVRVGSARHEFQYGYLLIPPDTPFSFENPGTQAMRLEYIALSAY